MSSRAVFVACSLALLAAIAHAAQLQRRGLSDIEDDQMALQPGSGSEKQGFAPRAVVIVQNHNSVHRHDHSKKKKQGHGDQVQPITGGNKHKQNDLVPGKKCALFEERRLAGAGFMSGDKSDQVTSKIHPTYGFPVRNAAACLRACKEEVTCAQMVYGRAGSVCFLLRNANKDGEDNDLFDSAVCETKAARNGKACKAIPNIRLPGGGFISGGEEDQVSGNGYNYGDKLTSAAECMQTCERLGSCKQMVFHAKTNKCYLMNQLVVDGGAQDENFVSAICVSKDEVIPAKRQKKCELVEGKRTHNISPDEKVTSDKHKTAPFDAEDEGACLEACHEEPLCAMAVFNSKKCYMMNRQHENLKDDDGSTIIACEGGDEQAVEQAKETEESQKTVPKTCQKFNGRKLAGGAPDKLVTAMHPKWPFTADTAAACQKECERDLYCVEMQFNLKTKQCYLLRNAYDNGMDNKDFASALCFPTGMDMSDVKILQEHICNQVEGKHFAGGGFMDGSTEQIIKVDSKATFTAKSPDDCQTECEKRNECASYAWQRSNQACQLVSKVFVSFAEDSDYVSGICETAIRGEKVIAMLQKAGAVSTQQ